MSIFNTLTPDRPITLSFLRKRKFYMDRWGSPWARKLDSSIFYERIIHEVFNDGTKGCIVAVMQYFPDTFDGYTSITARHVGKNIGHMWWGKGVMKNRMHIYFERGHFEDGYTGITVPLTTVKDFEMAELLLKKACKNLDITIDL